MLKCVICGKFECKYTEQWCCSPTCQKKHDANQVIVQREEENMLLFLDWLEELDNTLTTYDEGDCVVEYYGDSQHIVYFNNKESTHTLIT